MIVYRSGNLTDDNFTPRPAKDTISQPGRAPGLSVFDAMPVGSRKGQGIDVDLLASPLQAIPDDPAEGGREGHLSIAPVDSTGAVDQKALEEWASYRGTGRTHRFTQTVRDAVVQRNVGCKA